MRIGRATDSDGIVLLRQCKKRTYISKYESNRTFTMKFHAGRMSRSAACVV